MSALGPSSRPFPSQTTPTNTSSVSDQGSNDPPIETSYSACLPELWQSVNPQQHVSEGEVKSRASSFSSDSDNQHFHTGPGNTLVRKKKVIGREDYPQHTSKIFKVI